MADIVPSKAEIFKLAQAQSDSIQELSERLVKIEKLAEKQETRNQGVIYAVLIASVLILVTVGVEVILSTNNDQTTTLNIMGKINSIENQNVDIKNKLENFKQCLSLGGWKSCF